LVKRAFYIVGPTASGKSELAADVALRCEAEVVSADAFQIYCGLPLLTAQPNDAVRTRVRHHLIGELSLAEELSAEKFRRLAEFAIAEINRRGKLAIVAGGSGLYLKALTHGLARFPAVDPELRAKLNSLSLEELTARLIKVDPFAREKLDLHNKRRVTRALEIFAQTKQPPSIQQSQWKLEAPRAHGVFVYWERGELYARIDRRVETMFADGVIDEVARATDVGVTAVKTIGLAQIRQLLDGKIGLAECIAAIQQRTRQYAKRQLTWFRQQTNFESLNLSLLKDHSAAVDWILQKVALLPPFE
jgi:tRNA dimethylallyltransferase